MVDEAVMSSAHQSNEIGIEEISVQVTDPLNNGFLNFGISSEMPTCQVLLQRSEEMKSLDFQQLEMNLSWDVFFNRKHLITSHFNRRACIRQCRNLLTEISECYGTAISIYRWRLNAAIVYSILFRHGT
ncbi:hypothetical protein AVEN_21261-1 [Araneus ventricosus]|uniref:Uncharacterized protein n=1 Tax=Araneus ventricosus TaxID=182803 RepID=A0A4Y2NTW6_ARAVE|nr:hypothetical protein AVEN_21261-1 [Araneus ventricosus]